MAKMNRQGWQAVPPAPKAWQGGGMGGKEAAGWTSLVPTRFLRLLWTRACFTLPAYKMWKIILDC